MTSVRRPTVTMEISGPLERGEVAELYERACALLANARGSVLCCEVAELRADIVSVDALARLALAARRNGCVMQLSGANEELLALVCLTGLEHVLARAGEKA